MNQLLPMSLHFLAGIFGAIGQYYYKRGGARLGSIPIWANWQIALGILSFCIVMVLFVYSYKLGGRIAVVYPAYATTFLWGALLGKCLDGEPLNASTFVGIALIFAGVTAIGLGALKS
jgi:drug/metabolite transporter (DMT)-like permease